MSENSNRSILEVTHVSSRGTSFRITLPKKVAESIGLTGEGDIVIFYKDKDGRISMDKLRQI